MPSLLLRVAMDTLNFFKNFRSNSQTNSNTGGRENGDILAGTSWN